MRNFFNPCVEYLAFDDRKLLLIGVPVISMILPALLDLSNHPAELGYWAHQVPESMFFVIGYWLFYRWLIITLRKAFPYYKQAFKKIMIQVGLMLISAPILKMILGFLMLFFMKVCNLQNHNVPDHAQTLISSYLLSFLIVSIYDAVYYFVQYKKAIIKQERLETQHVQTELSNLRNQINPHFLFNSLNTLMNLIPTNPESAMNYLSKLSKFYRHAVYAREEKLIPVTKEIEFARLYIDLLRERFKDALNISIEVRDSNGQMIPPLSLQLLIENAVKHNVVSKDDPLSIEITYDAPTGELVVTNNVQKKIESVKSTGIGLDNIKKRFRFFTDRPVKIIDDIERFQVTLPTINP